MYDDYENDSGLEYDNYPRARSNQHRQARRPPPPPQPTNQPPPQYDDRYDQPQQRVERRSRKISYKSLAGMVVAIIALIFIVFIMFMGYSWYSITYEEHNEELPNIQNKTTIEYNLQDFSEAVQASATEVTNDSFYHKQAFSYDEANGSAREVKDVMNTMNYFFIFSILLLVLAIAMIPVAAIGKMPHGIPMAILLIALIFTLLLPIYFFFSVPNAVDDHMSNTYGADTDTGFKYEGEFWQEKHGDYYANGTEDHIFYDMNYGPEMAFWLAFVPMFIILAAIATYSSGKGELMYSGPPKDSRPPPRGPPPRGHDDERYYDDDYSYDAPPPPRPPGRRPQGRSYDDYEGGYNRGQRDRNRPPQQQNYDHDQHYDPPVMNRDYDYGPPPRSRRQRGREY